MSEIFRLSSGDRLVYRRISDLKEFHSVGVSRATKGGLTPAGEKFCGILRTIAAKVSGINFERDMSVTDWLNDTAKEVRIVQLKWV